MKEEEYKKSQLFKKLLKKMYEKGETEKDVSTKSILKAMENELRTIISK